MYKVVNFSATANSKGGISVVSENWLTPRKEECFWPPYKARTKFNKCLNEHEEPDDTWLLCPLERCFPFQTADLGKALEKAKEAEENSDIQSEAETNTLSNKAQRKRKIPAKFLVDLEASSSDEENKNTNKKRKSKEACPRPTQPARKFLQTVDSNLTENIQYNVTPTTQMADDIGSMHSKNPSTPHTNAHTNELTNFITPSFTHATHDSTGREEIIHSPSDGLLHIITQQLAYIKEQNKQILGRLAELPMSSTMNNSANLDELPVKLPVTSFEEMVVLEDFLVKNKEPSSKFISWMTSLGGSDGKRRTYRILKAVLTDNLAEKYSYFGTRGGKKAFADLALNKLVIEAAKINGSNTTSEVEENIKVWLKHARDRGSAAKK